VVRQLAHRPMAASVLMARWLDGPARRLTVAHRSRLAWSLADDDRRVAFCVMFPTAVRLPCACAVAPQAGLSKTPSSLSVGDGYLAWGDDEDPDAVRLRVVRWWRPARPDPRDHAGLAHAADPVGVRRLASTWPERLGSGPGLTPYADDVLCGALVTLRAIGHPSLPDLARDVARTDLERATTTTSASLLRVACEGWCIDELADLLRALARGEDTTSARDALLRVGSSSGRGLIEGIAAVLPRLAEPLLADGRAA
jgi:Protein of unknown function (DUF2877)